MFEPRPEALATAEDIAQMLALANKYSVQIGVDTKAGTDWPVLLELHANSQGEYWIETLYFGSHADGDGAVYTSFEEAYDAFVEAYND